MMKCLFLTFNFKLSYDYLFIFEITVSKEIYYEYPRFSNPKENNLLNLINLNIN